MKPKSFGDLFENHTASIKDIQKNVFKQLWWMIPLQLIVGAATLAGSVWIIVKVLQWTGVL